MSKSQEPIKPKLMGLELNSLGNNKLSLKMKSILRGKMAKFSYQINLGKNKGREFDSISHQKYIQSQFKGNTLQVIGSTKINSSLNSESNNKSRLIFTHIPSKSSLKLSPIQNEIRMKIPQSLTRFTDEYFQTDHNNLVNNNEIVYTMKALQEANNNLFKENQKLKELNSEMRDLNVFLLSITISI